MDRKNQPKSTECVNPVEGSTIQDRLWHPGGWEALRDDIDAEIPAKQIRIRKLRQARSIVERNLNEGRPFPQPKGSNV